MNANIDAQDRDGKTALHNCILHGHYDLCRFLLENNANVNLKTNNGHSALVLSESVGNQKIQKLIKEFVNHSKTW
ncbi:unnamed protein product [Schistosoma mattheei]|uniref:Uncharacterized protein n=1 Tax=Schistosoma mattheei TaxID=31246 RepID=A0A3P8CZI4_9TREM|nr:unnamed protein product [Schistosoma mattheei]